MSSNDQFEIVLVPGAEHSPSHYKDLLSQFEQNGHKAHAISLPSVGSANPKTTTASDDVHAVRNQLLIPLLDTGKNVVVIGHSYGGFIASGVIHGLGSGDRKVGGVVLVLVIVAGFACSKAISMAECTSLGRPHQHPSWSDTSVGIYQKILIHLFALTLHCRRWKVKAS